MQQYNIFQAIIMSFYSRKLYRDVAVNWGGKTFLYLLMLLALSWIYFTYEIQVGINKSYAEISARIIPQIPVITIKDGKASTPEARPYFIIDPDSHDNIAVLDTTGKIKTLDQAKATLLMTQTELITQQKENETRTYQIPAKLNYVIVPKVIDGYLIEYVEFAWILIFPFLVFIAFVYRIIQALLYSLLGKIFSSMTSTQVSYGQIMQITLVAVTPAIVVSTIQGILGINIPYQLWYYLLLSLCYIFYGIMANKK